MSWNLADWEETVEEIVDDLNRAPKRASKHKVLKNWRAQLERKPTSLQPFQIDVILREVQRRLKSGDK
jgi:hypothetical protein